MAERVHDRLAERRTWDLGHFLAGGAAVDDEAAADVGEHVELGAGDEVVDRPVPLLQVEDLDAAAVGEDPGLEARTGLGRAEERCCSVEGAVEVLLRVAGIGRRAIRAGDVLVVKSIDRLGRGYEEIIEQWRAIIKEVRADVVVLDMPLLDT